MTDYSKLTVVKLKEELKRRGLPQSGLKAVLVARLDENDAVEDSAAQEEPAAPEHGPEQAEPDKSPEPPEAPEPATAAETTEKTQPDDDSEEAATVEQDEAVIHVQTSKPAAKDDKGPQPERPAEAQPPSEATGPPSTQTPDATDFGEKTSQMLPPERPAESSTTQEIVVDSEPAPHEINADANNQSQTQQPTGPLPSTETQKSQSQAVSASQAAIPETQTTVDPDEEVEDSRKRKRRSHSPTPQTQDMAMKKLKGEDGSPRAKPTDDMIEVKPSPTDLSKPESAHDSRPTQSPAKAPPADARFKGLFAPAASTTADQQTAKPSTDRDVAPAQHPASSALYIRNLMRPLQVPTLRDHLSTIAQDSESDTKDVISEFFVDSIKSHCLVQFHNLAAASRVRSRLHDVTWPDEKNRKPLWVDYIPEEKLQKWIEVEQDAAGARPPKRWEVVYEDDKGEVGAFLQEVDSSRSRGDDKRPPSRRDAPPKPAAPPTPKGDPGQGFRALDDLFRFTAAKPKLYFLPVPERVVKSRLDRLAAGRGGGRDEEKRRFTFEEEELVDDGPEFRPGYRGRVRGGRGGLRGDSYRGDSYRGR